MARLTLPEVLRWRHDTRGLTAERWRELPGQTRARITREAHRWLLDDARENQLAYYQPVNADAARIHLSMARECGAQGGRASGKTATLLAEAAIIMTGVVPRSLAHSYPREKLLQRPARVRLVVTTIGAWDTNLKQKLQWFAWNGRPNERKLVGDPRFGHWGFIPRRFLLGGDWTQSWNAQTKVLTLVDARGQPWSTLQIISHDQDLKEYSQGAFDLIVEDEIPPEDRHRANLIRTMQLRGRVLTGGTPPDDRTLAVGAAWFFDQILTPGLERSNPAEVDAVVLWTEHNRTLDQAAIAAVARGLTPEQRRVTLHGEAIHLSGVIIRGFTEKPRLWCFGCNAVTVRRADDACETCGGWDLESYCHVWDDADLAWPGPTDWPTLFYMDPHQARPTACAWVKVDPRDGWWVIHEAEIAGDAATVRREVEAFERAEGLDVVWRKGDPKITEQHNQFAREFEGRPFTIREAFEQAGFPFEEANTNFSVAIERVEQALRPDRLTRVPRLRIHRDCSRMIYQVTHFTWKVSERREGPDVRDIPSRRHSDMPALLRYLANDEPEYRMIQAVRHVTPVSLARGAGRNRATGW